MREEVVNKLRDLNCQFYDAFANAFAASRGSTEPGLERIFTRIQPGDSVLDLGCGQGRIATLLPDTCRYVGLDFSAEMLTLAREQARCNHRVDTCFVVGDLLDQAWPPEAAGPFNWVILRAVLHHIPGGSHRHAVIARAAQRLAPQGRLIIANWQFLEIERLRRRLLPWETIGLTPGDVEGGDYLLDWQRDGYGLRYVHLIDEDETRTLAARADLQLEALFRADGHHNSLTLYAILKPT